MKENWFRDVSAPDSDKSGSGIYEWRIEGVGVYVGQAKRLASRMRAYPNNVRRLLAGLSWHGGQRQFRDVHRRLSEAHEEGTPVTFRILENCSPDILNERERHWIGFRKREAEDGGLKVINSN
jgi:hypothetical protein